MDNSTSKAIGQRSVGRRDVSSTVALGEGAQAAVGSFALSNETSPADGEGTEPLGTNGNSSHMSVLERKRLSRRVVQLNRDLLKNELLVSGNMDGRALCGRALQGGKARVDIRRAVNGGVFTGNLQSCGSVWHCPVCASKIKKARAQLVNDLTVEHQSRGGSFALLTLTVPHRLDSDLGELLGALSEAWDNLKKGARWQRLKDRYGIGYVRVLEVTYGQHSFHPHLHVLLFLNQPLNPHVHTDEWGELDEYFKSKWSLWVKKKLGRTVNQTNGVDLRPVYGVSQVSEYISSISKEMTRSDLKLAKSDNQTMFQVADAASKGEVWALKTWRHYLKVFKGRRFMTFSRGLTKSLLGDDLEEKLSDEALANRAVVGESEGHVSMDMWRALGLYSDGQADFLYAWQTSGIDGAVSFMTRTTNLNITRTTDNGLPVLDIGTCDFSELERYANGMLVRA